MSDVTPRKRCLIIDDSRVIRMVSRKILQELGFETEEAADGSDALEICNKSMPDAVLLDWKLPEMASIDFLKTLRNMPGGDTPVVVFCTADNDLEQIQEAIEAGANEYVMKPFDLEIIQAKFSQAGLL